MEGILRSALAQRPGSRQMQGGVVVELAGEAVALVCHAVPAALTVAAARELVGRPHLRDHQLLAEMGDATGPVHVIACHRNVTERQALDMLGFPDAVLVTPPFGVYVADDVQKVQLVFIRDCRDETATRTGAQRFLEWLEQTAEDERMVARAAGRRRIIAVIAEELEAARDGSHP